VGQAAAIVETPGHQLLLSLLFNTRELPELNHFQTELRALQLESSMHDEAWPPAAAKIA
jgi:hypothetical protein